MSFPRAYGRGRVRPAGCQCDHSFTCGLCLRNAPPPVWTPSTAAEQLARAIWAPVESTTNARKA